MEKNQINLQKLQRKLRKELDEDRYRHTLGVMYTGAALAMRYGIDLMQAQTAGLLHDCAKCIPNDKKLKLCEKYEIPISETELAAPFLLHAKLGAYMAEEKYGISDRQILEAVRWHTTGKPDMSPLEQIIFIADYIEPMRNKASNLTLIRRVAFENMDEACYLILRDTLTYLNKGSGRVDQTSAQAYEFYRDKTGHTEE